MPWLPLQKLGDVVVPTRIYSYGINNKRVKPNDLPNSRTEVPPVGPGLLNRFKAANLAWHRRQDAILPSEEWYPQGITGKARKAMDRYVIHTGAIISLGADGY